MSLRTRLAVAAAVAVAIAVALASGVAYGLVRHELRSQVDQTLKRTSLGAGVPGPSDLTLRPRFFRGDDRYQQLVNTASGVIERPSSQAALPVDSRDQAVANGTSDAFLRDAHVGSTHVRMITVPAGPDRAYQTARSLTETDNTLRSLRLALLLVAAGGVALAVGLGLLVSRAALRPVKRLTGAAEHIAETQDLGQSIEVHGRDEIARLASSFNAMLSALDESRQRQRQLVADASHELRTPLTSVRTNIEVLAGQPYMQSAERERLLADVTAQLGELGVLVGDLVELARDETPEPEGHPERIELDELVERAVTRARLHAPQLTFTTDVERAELEGHPVLLDRAVTNVLDNASKWSPPRGTVEVTLVKGDAAAEISVRDHGPGIPPEDLPHVFDRFYRSPAARSMPGSGLGLSIVRRALDLHGGTVQIQAAAGGGTLVVLHLPISPVTEPESPEPVLGRA